MSLDCLAVHSEGKKSGATWKPPVVRTLTLDVSIKPPPSWELPTAASRLLPTGESHRSWGSSRAGHILLPHLLPGLKSHFLGLFPDQLFSILG